MKVQTDNRETAALRPSEAEVTPAYRRLKGLAVLIGLMLSRWLLGGHPLAVDGALVAALAALWPLARGELLLLPLIYLAILGADYLYITAGYYRYVDDSLGFALREPLYWYFYGMAIKRLFAETRYPVFDRYTALALAAPQPMLMACAWYDAGLFLAALLTYLLLLSAMYLHKVDILYGLAMAAIGLVVEVYGVHVLQQWQWQKLVVGSISILLLPIWYLFGVALRRALIPLSLQLAALVRRRHSR